MKIIEKTIKQNKKKNYYKNSQFFCRLFNEINFLIKKKETEKTNKKRN